MRAVALAGMVVLAGCATSGADIRARGAYESLIIPKPYHSVSECVATSLVEHHDAGLSIRNTKNSTIVTEPVDGGGYFVEVTSFNKTQSQVATYASQNMLFFGVLSQQMMRVIKDNCL